MIIYHITKKEDLPRLLSDEAYTGDTLLTEGFIHCSTASQVLDVANQRFRAQPGLVLLCIETDLVKPEIRYENLEGGTKLFPHIYGPLNRDAVRNIVDLLPGKDGNFEFPPSGPYF
jgi:uncharacterized protein (DUF952 family)